MPLELPKNGAIDGEYVFQEKEADRAVRFFSLLKHIEGEWAGRPFNLEDWQHRIVWNVFGWFHAQDGTRRYRKVYVEVPRKNGKSTFAAGVALKLLLADDEPGAQVYFAAANRDQAGAIYRIASQMVYSAPDEVRRRCDVTPSTKRIVVESTGSFCQALASDAPSNRGINAHGVVIDELLAQPDSDLYDVLTTAQGARRQPLIFMFTTAGFDTKSLVGREHEYATKVASGVINDPTYLPVIYAADENDDIGSKETWQKANPLFDSSQTLQRYLTQEALRAVSIPAFENRFRREFLNIWTKQDVRWMPLRVWDASAGMVNEAELKDRVCYGGLDLASTTDLAAFALVFSPIGDETTTRVLMRFWVPEDNIDKRAHVDGVPYREWADEGLISPTPGAAIDYGFIREEILKLSHLYNIREIGFDRWGATQIAQELDAEGLNVIPIGQGFRDMSAPTKELMRMILSRELEHGGHQVLRWCADNVVVMQDPAGNLKPAKDKSKERIDGVVALIMAVDRESRNRASGDPRISFIG